MEQLVEGGGGAAGRGRGWNSWCVSDLLWREGVQQLIIITVYKYVGRNRRSYLSAN